MKRQRVQLMSRDREIMKLLLRARWLSTRQLRDRFFPGSSANAVNKRMAKLTQVGLLRTVRPNMTSQRWYKPSAAGAALVAPDASDNASLRYPFPRQLDHFARINDVRLWFERQPELWLQEFWAEWEYKIIGLRPAVVPDALAVLRHGNWQRVLAVEVDCATEHPNVLARKLQAYGSTAAREFVQAVLICVPGWRRLRSVVTACYRMRVVDAGVDCWLLDLNRLGAMSAKSRDVINLATLGDDAQPPTHSLRDLIASPVCLSCRQDGNSTLSGAYTETFENGGHREYSDIGKRA